MAQEIILFNILEFIYRALLRRLAQAVAGDPLAVRVVVRNPGHSGRARVFLSATRRASRQRVNRCDARDKAGEHHGKRTHVHVLLPADASHHNLRLRQPAAFSIRSAEHAEAIDAGQCGRTSDGIASTIKRPTRGSSGILSRPRLLSCLPLPSIPPASRWLISAKWG